ncbi:hypothetical protein B0J14DRAFT_704944 [Halenospora varia]|nr:hypothetical protein B0J14DRAFT_704944 [Halenospora varia]
MGVDIVEGKAVASKRKEIVERSELNATWSIALHRSFHKSLTSPFIVHKRKVHGTYHLPLCFTLAILPSNTHVEPSFPCYQEILISSSYSLIEPIIAILQVLSATTTIYHTRGDQLETYGYVAFGMTGAAVRGYERG